MVSTTTNTPKSRMKIYIQTRLLGSNPRKNQKIRVFYSRWRGSTNRWSNRGCKWNIKYRQSITPKDRNRPKNIASLYLTNSPKIPSLKSESEISKSNILISFSSLWTHSRAYYNTVCPRICSSDAYILFQSSIACTIVYIASAELLPKQLGSP